MQQEQRFTFDRIARAYDRRRPTYPAELFRDLAQYGNLRESSRVLEIGCGTGQATAPLAELGCEIYGLEPGPALAAQARENLMRFTRVRILEQTFEDWSMDAEEFDLVLSAQAFHWIDPKIRFSKAAAALRPGGGLAIMGNWTLPHTGAVKRLIDSVYQRHAPVLLGEHPSAWYSEKGPIAQLLAETSEFCDARVLTYPWCTTYSAVEYRELMETQSDHQLLQENCRSALLKDLEKAIENLGGEVSVSYQANLYLARVVERGMCT